MLMVYDVDNKTAIYETSGAKRFKERESLEIPAAYKGRTFHTWMAFIADDRMGISASRYCGSFIF